jgi:hypothetical protein
MVDNTSHRSIYKALQKLAEDVFACFLQPDYENNLYLYEHRIHISKIRCAALLQKHKNEPQLLTLYNGLLDCGLLRWRIKDKTVFGVCRNEMTALLDAIGKMLMSTGSDEGFLTEHIASFEAVYQSVLLVTAKEPLPFLLFIYSLNALKETFFASQPAACA